MQTRWAPLMLHGMWLGRGNAEGELSDDPSCLPGLSTCPLVFHSLDEASYFFANTQAALQLGQ